MNRVTHILKMGDQQLLTKDDYVELLKIRFNNPDIKFKEAEYDSQTEKMEGFLGEHNILKIKYSLNEEIHTANFFVKSKPKLQSSVDLADKLCMYEKEIFLYDKLMRIFENRGYNTCFAPKCYLCKDNGTLVMQDLKSEGYYLAERNDFFDLDKIKSSLKALAHFHGAFMKKKNLKSLTEIFVWVLNILKNFQKDFWCLRIKKVLDTATFIIL